MTIRIRKLYKGEFRIYKGSETICTVMENDDTGEWMIVDGKLSGEAFPTDLAAFAAIHEVYEETC